MSILQELEKIHKKATENKEEVEPYILIGANLNQEGQFDKHIVYYTMTPLEYLGAHEVLRASLEQIRGYVALEACGTSPQDNISVLDDRLNEILDTEFENIKSGLKSGDFNDSILNLVEKLNKLKTEIKIDDILPREDDNGELL